MLTARSIFGSRGRISLSAAMLGIGLVIAGFVIVRHFVGLYELGELDSAIVTMRILNANQAEFAKNHPDVGYLCRLSDIDPTIAARVRKGHIFEVRCEAGVKGKPSTKYSMIATPANKRLPVLCSGQSGVLREAEDGSVADCLESGRPL